MINNISSNYKALCELFNFSKKSYSRPKSRRLRVVEFLLFEECKKEVRQQGIKSSTEYKKLYAKRSWPSDPTKYYKEQWKGWHDFLDKECLISFEELKKEVALKDIQSSSQYQKTFKSNKWPRQPFVTFEKDWKGWDDFFGRAKKLSYEEIKKQLRLKGVISMPQYKKVYKNNGWPSNPNSFYKKEWKGCYDFFNTKKPKFISFAQLKKILKFEHVDSWIKYNKIYKKRNWPSSPRDSYKREWKGGHDFFGNTEPTKFPSFEEIKKEMKKEKIKFWSQYKKLYKEKGWPSRPQDYYKEWKNWRGKKFPSFNEFKEKIKIEGIEIFSNQYKKLYKKRGWPSNPNKFYEKEWKKGLFKK